MDASHSLENTNQIKALAHPLRQQILELMIAAPITTKQVADRLGEKPTKLYHHVDKLEVAGLIKFCLLYTSPSPRDGLLSRMPSSA